MNEKDLKEFINLSIDEYIIKGKFKGDKTDIVNFSRYLQDDYIETLFDKDINHVK